MAQEPARNVVQTDEIDDAFHLGNLLRFDDVTAVLVVTEGVLRTARCALTWPYCNPEGSISLPANQCAGQINGENAMLFAYRGTTKTLLELMRTDHAPEGDHSAIEPLTALAFVRGFETWNGLLARSIFDRTDSCVLITPDASGHTIAHLPITSQHLSLDTTCQAEEDHTQVITLGDLSQLSLKQIVPLTDDDARRLIERYAVAQNKAHPTQNPRRTTGPYAPRVVACHTGDERPQTSQPLAP